MQREVQPQQQSFNANGNNNAFPNTVIPPGNNKSPIMQQPFTLSESYYYLYHQLINANSTQTSPLTSEQLDQLRQTVAKKFANFEQQLLLLCCIEQQQLQLQESVISAIQQRMIQTFTHAPPQFVPSMIQLLQQTMSPELQQKILDPTKLLTYPLNG